MSFKPIALFVYGTLKQGERNFFVSQQAGWMRSKGAFVDGFELYHFPASHLRAYSYPGLVVGMGQVRGEVQWFADMEAALRVLDELEDEGGEYRRIETTAFTGGEGQLPVWIYVYSRPDMLAEVGAVKVLGEVWRPKDFVDG